MKRDGSTKFWSLQVRDGSVERKKHKSLGHVMLWTSCGLAHRRYLCGVGSVKCSW